MKRAAGETWRMRRMVSTPLMPGSRRSIMVMSGWRERCNAIASSPFPAWPTQAISLQEAMSAAMPIRIMGWSSTMRMRIGGIPNYRVRSCSEAENRDRGT